MIFENGKRTNRRGGAGRWLGVFLGACLLLAAIGCRQPDTEARELSLSYGGQELTVGMSEEELVARIGEANAREETPSCAGAGVDRLLSYPSLRVYVFAETGGQAVVRAISYTDDGAETAQGLGIGSPVDQVITALGEPDAREDGRLCYLGAHERLIFLFREARVTGILLEAWE